MGELPKGSFVRRPGFRGRSSCRAWNLRGDGVRCDVGGQNGPMELAEPAALW
jgi:hypothetical protein